MAYNFTTVRLRQLLSKIFAGDTKTIFYRFEDLSAGADVADRYILVIPSGVQWTISKASIVPEGSSAGVDDSNTAVIALKDDSGNTIVSKTYNTANQPPASGVQGNLGTLDSTYKVLSAGEKLGLSVTQGSTANLPGFLLQLEFTSIVV